MVVEKYVDKKNTDSLRQGIIKQVYKSSKNVFHKITVVVVTKDNTVRSSVLRSNETKKRQNMTHYPPKKINA